MTSRSDEKAPIGKTEPLQPMSAQGEGSFYTASRGPLVPLNLPLRIVAQPPSTLLRLSCYKLVLVEDGRGTIRLGTAEVPVAGPTLLCLGPREWAEVPKGYRFRATLFLPEVVNSELSIDLVESGRNDVLGVSGKLDLYWAEAFMDRKVARPRVLDLPPHAAQCLVDRFNRIQRELELQKCQFWASWARSFLIECLFVTAQLHHAPTHETSDAALHRDHPAAPVVLYLQARYGEHITISSLAREFHTNRTTLQLNFREYTGKTVGAFLRERRLAAARALLCETTRPLSEIATHVGFSDLATFARSFRRAYSMGPARFRRLRRDA